MADAPTDPTTSGPAPAEGEEPEVGADVAAAGAGSPGADPSRADGAGRWRGTGGGLLVDMVAVVTLLWPLMWLADNDAGRDLVPMGQYLAFLLLAVPVVSSTSRDLPGVARFLLLAIPLGALASFAFAWGRGSWVEELQVFAAMPVIAMAAARLWRRPWGHVALTGLFVVAWAGWFWHGMLLWWGWSDLGAQPRWELMSWHNQSGMLSAAFGLSFSGIVLLGRRTAPLVATILAGSGLAGLWLSGSRGALLFTLIALAAQAVIAIRVTGASPRSIGNVLARVGAVVVSCLAIVSALSLMIPDGSVSPLAARPEDPSITGARRIAHWEAAAGMFTERPLVGQGIGSYSGLAPRHTPTDGTLTASAHNEWLEAWAEGGLLFGVPMTILGAAVLLALWRGASLVRRADPADESHDADPFGLREGLLLGVLTATFAIAAHASIDFDLRYPSLAALLAVGLGITAAAWPAGGSHPAHDRPRPRHEVPRRTILAAVARPVALGICLVVAVAGTVRQARGDASLASNQGAQIADHRAPWDVHAQLPVIRLLMARGDLELAREAAARLGRWNPGDPRATMVLARIDHLRGDLPAARLADLLEEPPTWLGEWPQTAQVLLETGHADLADAVAAVATGFHPTYASWGITGHVADAWEVRVRAAGLTDRCGDVPGLLEQASASGFDDTPGQVAIEDLREVAEELCEVL